MGMRTFLKKIIDQTPLYGPWQTLSERKTQKEELIKWESSGQPVPPHLIKQETLLHYGNKYNLKVLVETGTYLGEMVEAMKTHFDRVYSIELSEMLYEKAKRRFKNVSNVELIHGDSGEELGRLMKKIRQPTLFWLDGHYSTGVTARGKKDTPIYEELQHILDAEEGGHVIVIDDARYFGTDPAYPTIEELSHFIMRHKQHIKISVRNDSIRITPCI